MSNVCVSSAKHKKSAKDEHLLLGDVAPSVSACGNFEALVDVEQVTGVEIVIDAKKAPTGALEARAGSMRARALKSSVLILAYHRLDSSTKM